MSEGQSSQDPALADVWARVTQLDVMSGAGCRVTASDGVSYLDFTSGIAVTSTGHCHPHVVAAIREQAGRFLHAQVNVYRHDLLEPLASRLREVTPEGIARFFFTNSGAEATEGAVKLAKQTTGRPNVIVFEGGFHGRTHLTMAMTTARVGYRAGHTPLPAGVYVAPFPHPTRGPDVASCLAALERMLLTLTAPGETAAMVLEPVLGEGGYVPCPPDFLQGVAAICAANGILFVADEVQSGCGRTGRMFAVEHYGVRPDVVLIGKGIASGMPFAAIGTTEDLAARWPVGSHGGTYGGNPVCCAAALATLDVLTAPGFLDTVAERGGQLLAGLERLAQDDGGIAHVRGLGLMVGVEFADPARVPAVLGQCVQDGHLLLMGAGAYGEVVRWMPPLVVSADEVDEGLEAFAKALAATR